MSTRGVVAVGTMAKWRGIYNHSDSYPTELGKMLYEHLSNEIIKEGKTLAEVGEAILKFDDWRNYLKGGVCEYCGKIASEPDSINGGIYGMAKPGIYADPECKHHHHEPLGKTYYYTQRDISKKPGWFEPEWVYILDSAADAIHVLDLRRGPEPTQHIGDITFTGVPDFRVLECGAGFERCRHYAWAHFPEIDREGPQSRLGTTEYLGLEPLENRNYACAYLIQGKRYIPTGSGVNGAYAHSLPSLREEIRNPDPAAWYECVKTGKGKSRYFPVARLLGKGQEEPYPGVTWVFPPTKVNPQETTKSL